MRPILGLSAVAASLLLPGRVWADEAKDTTDIIVTAQKRAEPLTEVPLSINLLDRDALAGRQITSPAGLDGAVPGLVHTTTAYDAPVYTIRGVGFFNEALGAPPAVSIYQDQVPLPFSAMTEGAALDVARVEILKGPQGALFGQNATGGAINFIPAQPSHQVAGGGSATYGRFDAVAIEGYLAGPLSRTVTARLAARIERADGFRYNGTATDRSSRNGDRAFQTARLLLDWTPLANVKFQLNLNGWRNRSDTSAKQKIGYAPLTPLALGGYADSPGYPDLQAKLQAYPNAGENSRSAGFDPAVSLRRDDRFGQVSLRSDVEFGEKVMLTSISALSALGVNRPNDIDGTIYPDIFIAAVGDITSVTQELRLSGTARADRLHWMIGGNYEHDTVHDAQAITMNGTNSGIGPLRFKHLANLNDQRVGTYALFASVDARLGEALTFATAVRYTERRDRFSGCLGDPGGPDGIRDAFAALSTALSGTTTTIAPGSCVTLGDDNKPVTRVNRRLDEANVSFRSSLSWQASRSGLLYASVTQGYKAGSFDTLPAIRPAQLDPVRQERVLAYEVGGRRDWFSHRLRASAALFYYDYRNKQIAGYVDAGPPFGLLPTLVSVPKSRVLGADAEVHWQPTRTLFLNFGAAWLDSKVRGAFVTAAPLGGQVNIAGENFPNAPRWELTGDAMQHFAVSGRWTAYIGGDVSYRSASKAAFGNEPLFAIRDYALIGLRVGIETEDNKWQLELWARNLSNTFYWTSVQHVEDTVTRSAGTPRTIGVTVRTHL
jgi:outer membrane receptor protein involved in Fe transport